MEIIYKSGKHHADVDYLSRYPIEDQSEIDEDRVHAFAMESDFSMENFRAEQSKDAFCEKIMALFKDRPGMTCI